jgi:hypothetical protein
VIKDLSGKLLVHMWSCDHHREEARIFMESEARAMGLMVIKEETVE